MFHFYFFNSFENILGWIAFFTQHNLTPTRHGVHQVLATFERNFRTCICTTCQSWAL